MLRAVADIGWDHEAGHAALVKQVIRRLPAVDDAAGVAMSAPALIIPRILDFHLCDLLAALYDKVSGRWDAYTILGTDG
jgi:hypothetical protein